MKNGFRVFELLEEAPDDGDVYCYLVPSQQFDREFASELEAMTFISDSQREGKKFKGDFVVLNVKSFQ